MEKRRDLDSAPRLNNDIETQIVQIASRFPSEVYNYVVDTLRYLAERGHDLQRLQYSSGSIQGFFELEVYDGQGRQII